MNTQDRRNHFRFGDQAVTDRWRKPGDRRVAGFHVIPVAGIEPGDGNESIQLT
jgi:hypothetical protein